MTTAAMLCIGTELTRGELLDSNAHYLAGALTDLGFEVTALDCVDDDPLRIERALRRLASEHDVVICTGGLGPTTDDITSECAARAAKLPLELHDASLEAIRARMQRFGRSMAPSNEKQAYFPRGARVLPNQEGTAPGFSLRIERAQCFFMPGVPREMTAMLTAHVVPLLSGMVDQHIHQVVLRSFGRPESTINDQLAGLESEYHVQLGYRAHFPEIEVKIIARDPDASVAERRARAAAAVARERLGDCVFAEGSDSLPVIAGAELERQGLRVATGESCTGGLVAKLVTDVAGSSAWFAGGVVAYTNQAKSALLGVEPATIAAHGAVSRNVASELATGARRVLDADLGIGMTGIAGPGGGTPAKPIGLVYYAVASAGRVWDGKLNYPGTRSQIRSLSAYSALRLLLEALDSLR